MSETSRSSEGALAGPEDIVKRLRRADNPRPGKDAYFVPRLYGEAADTIESLQTMHEELVEELKEAEVEVEKLRVALLNLFGGNLEDGGDLEAADEPGTSRTVILVPEDRMVAAQEALRE